jgi:hypothetical protein
VGKRPVFFPPVRFPIRLNWYIQSRPWKS